MPKMPSETRMDRTLALRRDGYRFVAKGCERHHSNVFETRLLLRRTICTTGEEAARLLYDEERFTRRGVTPPRVLKTLLGSGGVQGLDGDDHRVRKQMWLDMMTEENIQRLAGLAADEWCRRIPGWTAQPTVVLQEEVAEVFCRAVCTWAGVPLADRAVPRMAARLGWFLDSVSAVGPRYLRGRVARLQLTRWAEGIIDAARAGGLPAVGPALERIVCHRDRGGRFLDRRTAAVELLTLLRTTTAVSWFVADAALALHEHPEWRSRLQAGNDAERRWFVQEVRRYFPLFPFVVAGVRSDFDWHGYRFPAGRTVLVDVYGTNHDQRLWDDPDAFRPERFRDWDGGSFNFIPHGGGDPATGHRCPGEWITIALMETALEMLTTRMDYDVPPQDLTVRTSPIPTMPTSRFVISNVRRCDDHSVNRVGAR
jgi:fatty-acid peroxygenase